MRNLRQKNKLARRALLAGTAVLLLVSWGVTAPENRPPISNADPLVVHEWGTFLSVQGSDGVTLGGMVDSEEVLPSFVEQRGLPSWQRMLMFTKMETPVTYFYTNHPRDVQVRVDMPKGILTHWFPNVHSYGPKPNGPAPAAGSYLDWRSVHLIPPNHPQASRPNPLATFLLKDGREYSGIIESEDKAEVRLITGPSALTPIAQDQ